MTLKAVLFDIDGTLVDSNDQHVGSWAFAFREKGCPQEVDDIRAQIGKGGDLLVPAQMPDVGDDVRERLSARQGEHFEGVHLDRVRAFEKSTDLVERAHRSGLKVVLASSAKQKQLEHYVELLGIRIGIVARVELPGLRALVVEDEAVRPVVGAERDVVRPVFTARDAVLDGEVASLRGDRRVAIEEGIALAKPVAGTPRQVSRG